MKNLRIIETPLWTGSRALGTLKQVKVYDVVRDRTIHDIRKDIEHYFKGVVMSDDKVLIESFHKRENAELFLFALKNKNKVHTRHLGKHIEKRPRRIIERTKVQMFGTGIRYMFNEEGD